MEIDSYVLPLYRAAERGDIDAVLSMLSHAECEVDAVDETSQRTALQVASEKGFITIVELLLDAGASLQSWKTHEDCGYSALHLAAMGGSAATVELLVQRGADVHCLAFGRTPLHDSCRFGRMKTASVLLQSGSDVNAVSTKATYRSGYTALHYAAVCGSEEMVKLLLSHDADIGAVNDYGRTALHCAWAEKNPEVAELLLEMGGAFPSVSGATGASEVHYNVKEDVVRRFLNCEADINVRDFEGWTPLHWACRGKSPRVAECLLKGGADINADIDFNTPLHFAITDKNLRTGSRAQTDLVELLFQWGADVNRTALAGWTPLEDYFDFYSGHDDQVIAKPFAKHFAMMQIHNLFVDEFNLQAISDHEPSRDFFATCKAEIENMRRIFIGHSSVTFFNIFTKGPLRLADYMANESIQNAFESCDFECEFPIYAENLRMQFVLGRKRLDLLRKTDSVHNVSDFRFMPYVCMRHLNRCLTNDDLKLISIRQSQFLLGWLFIVTVSCFRIWFKTRQ